MTIRWFTHAILVKKYNNIHNINIESTGLVMN